jgi:sugar O-acyltransferase (sialic acid O-acetyltransferase NeuD family)
VQKKIIIIGNSLSAEILHGYIKRDNRYKIIAFSVEADHIKEKNFCGLEVVDFDQLKRYNTSDHKIVLAVGYSEQNKVRQKLFERVKQMGFEAETYIHPDARVYNNEKIGEGSVILANSVIEPCSTIGANTVVWANCTIGHHSIIGDNIWIASGTVVAGEAAVGDNSFIGVNCTISNKVKVGSFNIVGANTCIQKCTKDNEVYLSRSGEIHRFNAADYSKFLLK